MSSTPVARIEAWGRRAALPSQVAHIEASAASWAHVPANLGVRGVSAHMADLLDIASVVHRAERQLSRRAVGNANVRYALRVPVRDPGFWSGQPGEALAAVLGFLGDASWELDFRQRHRRAREPAWSPGATSDINAVTLFSGGLDSLCGAGARLVPRERHALVSAMTRQGELQRDLAAELGLQSPAQWRLRGEGGRGRSFHYRSFLFLALGAATAASHGARTVLQFENGILASAVPPLPSLRMTRHAHPRTRTLMERLLGLVTGDGWTVANPFAELTKRECFEEFLRAVGPGRARALGGRTETCWNLYVPHAFGVRGKANGSHCGVCVPCIVRRTALDDEDYAFDLRGNEVRNDDRLGLHFREYYAFLDDVGRAADTLAFWRVLPAQGRDLLDDGHATLEGLERMFRRFRADFWHAFRL